MEVKSIKLHNLGRFNSIETHLAPTDELHGNVTVFIGNNGAGKTSVLKALATCLSWLVARIRTEKGVGNSIPENVIMNGQSSAMIDIQISGENGKIYSWSLAKTPKGKKVSLNSNLNDATLLADFYRKLLTDNEQSSLPLIAFYPVERVVIDIPLKIRERHSFLQLDGYDNSLNQGVDFRRFFEWFREREDSENESGFSPDVFRKLLDTLGDDVIVLEKLKKLSATSKDRQLNAVRTAIENFMPEFNNLRVRRKPRLHMSIDKCGHTLNVLQLSQGEKSLMALVGDIARRLAMMNPILENPLLGDGIVLIDEVDMHLHPMWQRKIIKRLVQTFPHCQFILTTHSPLVISECKDVLVYSLDDGGVNAIPSQYGEDANSVLINIMGTNVRNEIIEKKINDILDLIQDADSLSATENIQNQIDELSRELSPNHLEIIKANLILRKKVLKIEKNK